MTPPDKRKEQCERHEQMVIGLTKMESEVESMREQQTEIKESLQTITEKLSNFEAKILYVAGGLGALSFVGSAAVIIISNADKIKGLFG